MAYQARRFTVTLWVDLDEPMLPELYEDITFFIGGLEECPTTGRLHYQSYCETERKHTEGAVAEIFRRHGWDDLFVAASKGDKDSNEVYCFKDKTNLVELGSPRIQGERKDIHKMRDLIVSGTSVTATEFPAEFQAYGRVLDRIMAEQNAKRTRVNDKKCVWLWGATGVGKTRYVREMHPDHYQWKYTEFQTYKFEDCILLDEFRGQLNVNDFLILTDPYDTKYKINIKFMDAVPSVASFIYVTSDRHPQDIFTDTKIYEQVMRRFEVVHLTKPAAASVR